MLTDVPTICDGSACFKDGSGLIQRLVVCGVLVSAVACGSSTTQPSGPVYPNLVGSWIGLVAISVTQGANPIGTNTCTSTWTFNNETTGNFIGTVTLAGGTSAPCVESATFTGSVT